MRIEPEGKRIVIQTREGNPINCEPAPRPMSSQELARCQREFDAVIKPMLQFASQVQERRGPTNSYNCHGLAFLMRRARLIDQGSIEMVLADDGYDEVRLDEVQPGDIAVYRDENGEVEHTGVVVAVDPVAGLRVPILISKWGSWGEYVHRCNNSPYRGHVLFMREGSNGNRATRR